nr:glycosyltransferase family 2 protein [Bacteroidales bacterium]
VLNTLPADDSGIEWSVAIASSNGFGVGNAFFRTGISKIRQVDTVPFGCFRRELFDRIGFFDEELVRNQDDEFNARIIRSGGKIFLLPEIEVVYIARGSLAKIAKTYFQYGLFKPLVNKKIKVPATFRQFVPVLFVASLLAGLPFAVFFPAIRWIYLCCLAFYFGIGFSIGLQQAFKHKKPVLFFLLPLVFFLMHLSYGCGYWKGLWKVAFGCGFQVKDSR